MFSGRESRNYLGGNVRLTAIEVHGKEGTVRPTKLTPEVADRIVEAIRLGCTYADAAKAGRRPKPRGSQ